MLRPAPSSGSGSSIPKLNRTLSQQRWRESRSAIGRGHIRQRARLNDDDSMRKIHCTRRHTLAYVCVCVCVYLAHAVHCCQLATKHTHKWQSLKRQKNSRSGPLCASGAQAELLRAAGRKLFPPPVSAVIMHLRRAAIVSHLSGNSISGQLWPPGRSRRPRSECRGSNHFRVTVILRRAARVTCNLCERRP